MNETPDELAVRYEHLATRVAVRYRHRLPPGGAGFDDLKAVCWMAVLTAARSFDPGNGMPWPYYATIVTERAARRFLKVEWRRGLTARGPGRAAMPVVVALDRAAPKDSTSWDEWERMDGWVPDHRRPEGQPDPRELLAELARRGLDPDAVDAAFLVVVHGMSQKQVAELWGVSRQRVGQILEPLWDFLRGES